MTVTNCQRCEGSGVYNGTRRDGSTYSGPCFACQGGGPRFVRRRAYAAAQPAVAPAAPTVRNTDYASLTLRQRENVATFARTQPAAYAWLIANRESSEFAASLLSGCARYGGLTPRQLAAVERNLNRPAIATAMVATPALPSDSDIGFVDPIPPADVAPDHSVSDAIMTATIARAVFAPVVITPPPLPVAVAPVTVDLDRVRVAMESARASGLRKVRLDFGNVSMRLSGPSFRLGAGIILCYLDGVYRGTVDASNVWRERYGAGTAAATLDAFRAVGRDPQAAARTHGQATSHCSCCRRRLTDPVSVMANIGPVCARRFGWSF